MTTATRTRSMNTVVIKYLEGHLKLRRKQAEAGEIANPSKVEEDAKQLVECGQQLLEIAEQAKKTAKPVVKEEKPRMITNSDVESALRKQLEELQKQLDSMKEPVTAKKRPGRPPGSKNKKKAA